MFSSKTKQKLLWTLQGFALGVTILIPGMSAGTLAVIMNIYEKIISSGMKLITLDVKKTNDDFLFLLCLLIGTGLALLSFAKWISYLLTHFPLNIYSFFIGLILASLPSLFRLIEKKWYFVALIIFTTIFCFISLSQLNLSLGKNESSLLLLFLSGFLGSFASILPGLSGSTILLLIGTYHTILNALINWHWLALLSFVVGSLLAFFSAFFLINLFLKQKKSLLFSIIIGLIIGSLPSIFPWNQWPAHEFKMEALSVVSCIILGIFVFLLINKFCKKTLNKNEIS